MRSLIEELRTKRANLRRVAARKAQSAKLADLPAVESYRAPMATWQRRWAGQTSRTALRGLVGTVPVFAEGRKLYGRFGLDHAQLMRSSNPGFIESSGSGACFGATKTKVVCFSVERIDEPLAIPDICGNGHPLTPENVTID